MWWIPITIGIGYLISKCLEDDVELVSEDTILSKNFYRLGKELSNIGDNSVVTVLGQCGAGKSSLINKLSKGKAVPKAKIGGSTDATDWSQTADVNFFCKYKKIWFLDTPGYDTSTHPVNEYINKFPFSKLDNVIFAIAGKIRKSDELIYNEIRNRLGRNTSKKIIIAYRSDDEINNRDIIMDDLDRYFKVRKYGINVVLFSNRHNMGIDEICSIFKVE